MAEADPPEAAERVPESLAARTARDLADLSIAADPGTWLGAEAELVQRLGVSRPTLRQAAKMVEADKLIAVRRGQGGGFFATRPTASEAIRAPARYLALNGAKLEDIVQASRAISEEAAASAAQSADPMLRGQLQQLADRLGRIDPAAETPASWIRQEAEMTRLIVRMSANPVIELFMEISYSFGHWERGRLLYQTAEERSVALKLARNVAQAILDGDSDVARLMTRRRSEMVAAWLANHRHADND
jgi:GntR family transcriptional repressor for pyruvate dehydrogenase complex